MTVHLIKLCVGVETVNELADWQDERLKRLKREKQAAGTVPPHAADAASARRDARRRLALLGDQGLSCSCGSASSISGPTRRRTARHVAASCSIPELVGDASPSPPRLPGVALSRGLPTRRETPRDLPRAPRRYRPACAKICASFALSTGSGRGHRHVVDQPRLAEIGGDQHARALHRARPAASACLDRAPRRSRRENRPHRA